MKTEKQITKAIKNSLLSDRAIKLCLDIHRTNPGMFSQFITKFERDIQYLINNQISDKKDIYDAYLVCKDKRFIRLSHDESMAPVERTVIAMVAQLSRYREEIITGDLLGQIKVVSF